MPLGCIMFVAWIVVNFLFHMYEEEITDFIKKIELFLDYIYDNEAKER